MNDLPPGVNSNMIPGNRSEDLAYDNFWTDFEKRMEQESVPLWSEVFEIFDDTLIKAVDTAYEMGQTIGYLEGYEAGKEESSVEGIRDLSETN